ncbi:MAG: hypothetical protein IPM78_14140 [Moraxellaceae bacterium]|nr:hypothetical protein [Moraxellaceae bacterium]
MSRFRATFAAKQVMDSMNALNALMGNMETHRMSLLIMLFLFLVSSRARNSFSKYVKSLPDDVSFLLPKNSIVRFGFFARTHQNFAILFKVCYIVIGNR